MSIINAGDFPIDPQIVDGTELADRLNRYKLAQFSNNASPTRPADIVAGGIWTRSGGAGGPVVMLFDGTRDVELGPNQGQALSGNGYVKLPGGLIVQWGYVSTGETGPVSVTFPIAFTTAPLNAQATVVSDGSGANTGVAVIGNVPSTTTISIGSLTPDTGVWAARTVYWMAIGV